VCSNSINSYYIPCLLQELKGKTPFELVQIYNQAENIYLQAEILQALLNTEGLFYRMDGETVEEKLEHLVQLSGSRQIWSDFFRFL